MRSYARYYAVGVSVLLAACGGGGERTVIEPPPPTSTDFVLTFRSHDEDMSVAQQLGWTSGIPGAQVTIAPAEGYLNPPTTAPRSLTTSATGTVSLAGMQPGHYRVTLSRLFTSEELAKVGGASGAVAYVGESEVFVASTSGTATVQVPASYRRSLIISEWSFVTRYIPGGDTYLYGGFLELYNNSDTTVYLDGVLIAEPLMRSFDTPLVPCALMAPYRNDPAGIWAERLAAFPGSGRTYPLAPGRHVVVATDAVDHSVLFPGMIDLRKADFEFTGAFDVDNPAVPNMIDRSLRDPFFGHGLTFSNSIATVTPVVAPTDTAMLPKAKLPPNGTEYLRLPRERMLDVFTTITTYFATRQPPLTPCPELVHASMDRRYGIFLSDTPDDYLESVSRKVLTTLPNGRLVLQHTRTSANDFKRTPRTPGVVAP